MNELPPVWLIELLEDKLASKCLDNPEDRRVVAEEITNEMMQRMLYKSPAHQGGRLRVLRALAARKRKA